MCNRLLIEARRGSTEMGIRSCSSAGSGLMVEEVEPVLDPVMGFPNSTGRWKTVRRRIPAAHRVRSHRSGGAHGQARTAKLFS